MKKESLDCQAVKILNLTVIDQMIITIVPVLLGEGVPLFDTCDHPISLKTTGAQSYKNGFVQIQYNKPR